MIIDKKTCVTCGETKNISCFSLHKGRGRRSKCRGCIAVYNSKPEKRKMSLKFHMESCKKIENRPLYDA